MADVTITVDGKKITAPAGALLIDVCRKAGIEIPAFCYYPGLSLQAACRMCVVRQEKVPKLQTACTTTVAEGQVFFTETDEIKQARKATLQLLLGNHPLDCPVCDAGGECELQDMTFKYGAGESLYAEAKNHRDEQQWSPAVYYDRPRCILCYRCVRICGEGMDVWALGVSNRGSSAVITPNKGAELNCEECGMCIDICPVGALTSGSYRYKTRPWEMNHVATICAHCGDGCKVTLGVRQSSEGAEILRADNRDQSGLNGDFLCGKGRFGFDFVESEQRLTKPMVRNAAGKLEVATWEQSIRVVAEKLNAVKAASGGEAIGVIGSNYATNEENYLLQKFARTVLGTNNIDHVRTAEYARFVKALAGKPGRAASIKDAAWAPAILLVGGNATEEHPLLAMSLRTNVRLSKARLYVANQKPIKLDRQAKATLKVENYAKLAEALAKKGDAFADAVNGEEKLLVVINGDVQGAALDSLLKWGIGREGVQFALLGGAVNSRGAADMGVLPDALPGYVPVSEPSAFTPEYGNAPKKPGLALTEMLQKKLGALIIDGTDPFGVLGVDANSLKDTFVVVISAFESATTAAADVVLPASTLYEKTGTVTNSFGDVQLAQKAADRSGVKTDFEIIVRIAGAMGVDVKTLVPFGTSRITADLGQTRGAQAGEADRHAVWLSANNLEPKLSPFDPMALLDEIERLVAGYKLDRLNLIAGNSAKSEPGFVPVSALAGSGSVVAVKADLFNTPGLSQYSKTLAKLAEHESPAKAVAAD